MCSRTDHRSGSVVYFLSIVNVVVEMRPTGVADEGRLGPVKIVLARLQIVSVLFQSRVRKRLETPGHLVAELVKHYETVKDSDRNDPIRWCGVDNS